VIHDITWRYTTLRELSNTLTIVPNARLASSITANHNRPSLDKGFTLQLSVRYDADLANVERMSTEVAQQVMKEVDGGVPQFTPLVRYIAFTESSIQFVIVMRSRDYLSQGLLKHELIKRLRERYEQEGLEIPYPIRTVMLQEQKKP
jgi:small-conductance mechanosensitive channel